MATPYQERKISAPQLNEGDAPYFEAASQGKLLIKYCNDCKKYHHYPRALCPFCFSDKTEWKEAQGTGTIYTFSVSRKSGPVPYAIGYVTLDEGPSMMTNIVECDLDTIKCGQKVKVTFKPTEGGPSVPMFRPV
jgi:uncharacterized protein